MVDQVVINEEVAVGFQAAGGGWSTTIVPLSGGKEHLNQNWAAPRRRYEVQYNNKDIADINALQAFIDDRRGAANPFLLKDWTNYQLTDHTILTATGGETTAQIVQIWGSTNQFSRTIRYLKSGTLVVKKNSVTLTLTTDYTVNSAGLITFVSSLSVSDVITVTCQFYVPVRFETDDFMIEATGPSSTFARIPRITLVEYLE